MSDGRVPGHAHHFNLLTWQFGMKKFEPAYKNTATTCPQYLRISVSQYLRHGMEQLVQLRHLKTCALDIIGCIWTFLA